MMHIRNLTLSLATGVAWLIMAVLATTNLHAQPVRRSRQEATQRLAQNASAQISPTDCPDRPGSSRAANEARELHRSRNLLAAEAAWDTAITLCGLPDRYEGRARTREARQGELDGEERLRLLDGAISDYTTAVQRAHFAQGFDSSAIEAALPALRTAREALNQRLHPTSTPPVAPRPVVAPTCVANLQVDPANCGACGNRCAGDQQCHAGRCERIAGPRPVTTPAPRRSHALPIALMAGGGVILASGAILWGVAAGPADSLCEENNRQPGCTRLQSGLDPRTARLIGQVMTGVGAAAAIAGLVAELLPRERAATPRRAWLTGGLDANGDPVVGVAGTF